MAKAFTSCITGVGRFEMVRRAALPPSLRQLMAFSGSERTMASFDLTVKVLNPITHHVVEIFSQAISRSSPRCPKVASGSATKLAASAFCRMGASRILRRLKAFPQVASGNLRRTCKVECGSQLSTGWRGLKVPSGTSLDHKDATRKSIPTVFLSIAEEQCGPTQEWGWCFFRKARGIFKSRTHTFLKMLTSKRLLTARYGWLRRTAPFVPSLTEMGNIRPMALLSM